MQNRGLVLHGTDLSEERKKRLGTIMQHDTVHNEEGPRVERRETERKREEHTVRTHTASNVRGFARPSITIN